MTRGQRTARTRMAQGNWGERTAKGLLAQAGFTDIQNLNEERRNFPFADFMARRGGNAYVISVKARKMYGANGHYNRAYNVRGKHHDLAALAQARQAMPAWVIIQRDEKAGLCHAYFGTMAQIDNARAIPTTPEALATYECLGANLPLESLDADMAELTGCPRREARRILGTLWTVLKKERAQHPDQSPHLKPAMSFLSREWHRLRKEEAASSEQLPLAA